MTPEERSDLMSRIRSKNTKPELSIRRLVFAMGYRYRLHRKELPGKPDLVFVGRKKVIFVNGCFWHSHSCGRGFKPKTNVDFWQKKLEANRQRDKVNIQKLELAGWKCLVIWECELSDMICLSRRIEVFLGLARKD